MFKNLFGRNVKDERPAFKTGGLVSAIAEAKRPPKKMVTVEDVHRELLTASEEILRQANELIAGKLQSKASRLVSLGFAETKDVRDSKNAVRNRTVADVVEHFMVSHPFNKVIPRETIFDICKKYGLVFSNAHRFTGFVPEKNLKEIEAFKYPGNFNVMAEGFSYGDIPGTFSNFVESFKSREEAETFIKAHPEKSLEIHNPSGMLMIAAPVKDMKLNSWERVQDNQIVHVPDPVVLFPVAHDCFLIVTAWGDEASDPLVVNSKMN